MKLWCTERGNIGTTDRISFMGGAERRRLDNAKKESDTSESSSRGTDDVRKWHRDTAEIVTIVMNPGIAICAVHVPVATDVLFVTIPMRLHRVRGTAAGFRSVMIMIDRIG